MITEQALNEAIAECQGERNPNANTCLKLAAFYSIKDKMYPETQPEISRSYSYDAPAYHSDTEFANVVQGRSLDEIMPVLDEMMNTLQVLHPRLYDAVMRKLRY